MPKLPTVVDSMGNRPVPQNGVRVVGYSAGQEGQAIAGVGRQLSGAADELYARNQKDALSEAQAAAAELNDFSSQSLFDPENGALTKNGVDAANISTQYGESFQAKAAELGSRITNPQARRAYEASVQSMRTQHNEALNRHQVQQTELVNKQNNQALVESEINSASHLYSGPGSITPNLGRISDAIAAQGRADGAGGVAIGVAISKAQSAAYTTGITQRALTDPIGAMADLQQVRNLLTADDLGSLENKLRPLAETQQAIDLVNASTAGVSRSAAAPSFSPEVNSAIQTAAQKYGVDASLLSHIARLESGGDPNVPSPSSGAMGLFQFMPDTAKEFGLSNPRDPVQSADAAARLVKRNQETLRSALGREPTPGELYLAHQQGAGGARTLLRNPNMNVVDALELAYNGDRNKAEAAVTQNGGDTSMTAGQFAGLWEGRLGYSGQPQAAPSSYEDFLKAANGNVRVARQAVSFMRESVRENNEARKANETAAVNDAYAFINANGRAAFFTTPEGAQLRVRLQEFSPKTLLSMTEEDKPSDPNVFQYVRGQVVRGQPIQVTDYIEKLSRSDTEELIKMQQDSKGTIYRSLIHDQMELITPVLTAGIKDDAVKAQTVLDFTISAENALKGASGDRLPNAQDAQNVIDMLMMRGTVTKNDDSFGAAFSRAFNPLSDVSIAADGGRAVLQRSSSGMLFQAQPGDRFVIPGIPYREGTFNISGIEMTYEEMVQQIASSLRSAGFNVTPANMAAKYQEFMERSANE